MVMVSAASRHFQLQHTRSSCDKDDSQYASRKESFIFAFSFSNYFYMIPFFLLFFSTLFLCDCVFDQFLIITMNTNHLFFFIKLKITAPNSSSSLCKQRQNINSLLLHIKDRNYRVLKFILSWHKKKKGKESQRGIIFTISLLITSFLFLLFSIPLYCP